MKRFRLILLLLIFLGTTCYLIFPPTQTPYLTVVGNIKMCDGIGRQSAELIRSLHQEMEVGFLPTMKTDFTDLPLEIEPIVKSPCKRFGKVVVFESSLPDPNEKFYRKLKRFLKGPKKKNQIRIAYSMTETDMIPELWAEGLNSYFDAVAVPDQFLVDVYKKSGVKIPIFLLPLSIQLEDYLNVPLKENANTPFCFINLASMIGRKNHEALIKAFHMAFGDDPSVQLLLNYRYAKGDALEKVQKLLDELDVKNIILKGEPLEHKAYFETFLKGDVFVTLSKGEGFSIQPREAMALGMPVIVSDNTAHKTIIASGLATGVSCPTKAPYFDPFKKGYFGQEALADIEEAAFAMKEIRDHYQEALNDAGKRREWVKQYQFKSLKSKYLSLIKPKKVILGDHDEICDDCLITSSKELYNKYKKLL